MAGKVRNKLVDASRGKYSPDRPVKEEPVHYWVKVSPVIHGNRSFWSTRGERFYKTACGIYLQSMVSECSLVDSKIDEKITCPDCKEVRALQILASMGED